MEAKELKEILIDMYSDYLSQAELPDNEANEKEFLEEIYEHCGFVSHLESGIGQIVSKYEVTEYSVYEMVVGGENVYFAIPYIVLPYGADYELYENFSLTFEDVKLADRIETISYTIKEES